MMHHVLKVKHTYMTANEKLAEDGGYVEVATREKHLHVGCGCRIEAYCDGKQIPRKSHDKCFGEQNIEFGDIHVEEGKEVQIVKYVSMYSERECPTYELHSTIKKEIEGFVHTGFENELKLHEEVYHNMWENADIKITGDDDLNRAVRFNIFHLMSTGNEHDDHVKCRCKASDWRRIWWPCFWDTELFMLPFLHGYSQKQHKILKTIDIIC